MSDYAASHKEAKSSIKSLEEKFNKHERRLEENFEKLKEEVTRLIPKDGNEIGSVAEIEFLNQENEISLLQSELEDKRKVYDATSRDNLNLREEVKVLLNKGNGQ